MTHPLPPLNTLGFVVVWADSALPTITPDGWVCVFPSDDAAKKWRAKKGLTASCRVIAVAVIPLMSSVPAGQAAVSATVPDRAPRRRRLKSGSEVAP